MTSVFPMEIYIYLEEAIYAVSIMRTCSLALHWEMDFIPWVCMWMFYILGTFVYIMECTCLDVCRISLSNVSLFKHPSSFWTSCSKAANVEIRGGEKRKYWAPKLISVSPSSFEDFYTSVFYVAFRTVVQRTGREQWLQISVLTRILMPLCQWEISIFLPPHSH